MEGKYRIPLEDICKQYPFDLFDFKDTSGLEPLTGVIGQKRAIEAIDFGLNMKGPGYHIFVTGVGGTGKSSIVRELLAGHAAGDETSQDLCLVNNFENEYCPVAIEMPAGSAVYFSESMTRFVEVIKARIPELFETAPFQEDQKKIYKDYANRQKLLLDEVDRLALQEGLTILKAEADYQVVPLSQGEPMSEEAYEGLDGDARREIEEKAARIQEKLEDALLDINRHI